MGKRKDEKMLFSAGFWGFVADEFVVFVLSLFDAVVAGDGVDGDERLVQAGFEFAHDGGVFFQDGMGGSNLLLR